jgi:hypothetical protein
MCYRRFTWAAVHDQQSWCKQAIGEGEICSRTQIRQWQLSVEHSQSAQIESPAASLARLGETALAYSPFSDAAATPAPSTMDEDELKCSQVSAQRAVCTRAPIRMAWHAVLEML